MQYVLMTYLLICITSTCCATRRKGGINEYSSLDDNERLLKKWKGSNLEKNIRRKNNYNFAIITAGHIRSFYYVMQSWERYIFSPLLEDNMYLFSHIVVSPSSRDCPIVTRGLQGITKLSAEYEISYSDAPFTSHESFPNICCNGTHPNTIASGGVLDMHQRRRRAYTLSRHFAIRYDIQWDLVIFLRPDAAFFGTRVDFHRLYLLLHLYQATSHAPGILVPGSCNFNWLCDRMAVGLPQTMDIYFNISAPQAAAWYAVHPDHFPDHGEAACMSELVLAIWLWLHGVHHLELEGYAGFATLRMECGALYCKSSRKDFLHGGCIQWMDTTLIGVGGNNLRLPVSDEDIIANSTFRCGKHSLYTADTRRGQLYDLCVAPELYWRVAQGNNTRFAPLRPHRSTISNNM